MVALGGNQVLKPAASILPSKTFSILLKEPDMESAWYKLNQFEIGLSWHCMSQMDSITLVVTGGYQQNPFSTCSQNSYFYDLIFGRWSEGPMLKEVRAEHGCSFIGGRDGKPTAIIVGGYGSLKSTRLQTVEIYNRILKKWESGPSLPRNFFYLQVSIHS